MKIKTLNEALYAIGQSHNVNGETMRVTCCGMHNGKAWIGYGQHVNDNGREVVAPALVVFLPCEAKP